MKGILTKAGRIEEKTFTLFSLIDNPLVVPCGEWKRYSSGIRNGRGPSHAYSYIGNFYGDLYAPLRQWANVTVDGKIGLHLGIISRISPKGRLCIQAKIKV